MIAALVADDGVRAAAANGGKQAMQLSTTVRRCGVLNGAACAMYVTPDLSAEALHYSSALLSLPTSLVPPSTSTYLSSELPKTLFGAIRSRHTSVRRAAVGCERLLSETLSEAQHASGGAAALVGSSREREALLGHLLSSSTTSRPRRPSKKPSCYCSPSCMPPPSEPSLWLRALRASC